MIRIKLVVTYPSFADTTLAKLLIKLARWRNWNESGTSVRVSPLGSYGDVGQVESVGSYISRSRWNFRLASKIATKFKRWEETREANKMKKQYAALLKLVIKPESGRTVLGGMDLLETLNNQTKGK